MRIAKRSFEIAHQPRLAHATHANEQGSIATGPVSTTARDGRELLEHTKPKPFEKPTNRTARKGNAMTIHNSLSELIGNTPLVKLNT